MPVRKRKFYIKLFNEEQERRTAAAPPQQKGHRTREISGDDVNKYTGKK